MVVQCGSGSIAIPRHPRCCLGPRRVCLHAWVPKLRGVARRSRDVTPKKPQRWRVCRGSQSCTVVVGPGDVWRVPIAQRGRPLAVSLVGMKKPRRLAEPGLVRNRAGAPSPARSSEFRLFNASARAPLLPAAKKPQRKGGRGSSFRPWGRDAQGVSLSAR